MAGFRLDRKDGGVARLVVAGKAEDSRLYQRVSATSRRMPPAAAGPALSGNQIQLIKRWIDEGAKWEPHWAYVAPQAVAPPAVKNEAWVRTPVDRFILARLEREGWKPSAEADKPTLLRRLSFDLTGLPPTPAEIDTFLADRAPDAYEKQVDRLLASPRYGERMAMQWLDLARYADTHGYHIDSHRDMWHWRDWVIAAFNRNMPYNEFIVDQLAGDLLPNATVEQKIATGFNRNHMINFEGGAIAEEYQNEYVVDRVETTSVAFLGTTMGCARCHDHKYDPISQREFYRFYAFFNTIPEKGLDGRKGNADPVVQLPTQAQAREQARVKEELAASEKKLPEKEIAALQTKWEAGRFETMPKPPQTGLIAHYEMDGSLADSSGHYARGRILRGEVGFGTGMVDKDADFGNDSVVDFGPVGDFDRGDRFTIAGWVRENRNEPMDVLHKLAGGEAKQGYELVFGESIPIGDLRRGSQIGFRLTHRAPDDAIEIRTKEHLPRDSKESGVPRPWYHVAITYDGSSSVRGLVMWINGERANVDVLHDHLTGSFRNSGALRVGAIDGAEGFKGQLDDLRIYGRVLDAAEIRELAIEEPARATLFMPEKARSRDQTYRLREYFLTYGAPESYRQSYAQLTRLKAQRRMIEDEIPTSMVMSEMAKPRETAILARGDYRNRGEKVTPGVPAILPPLPAGAPLNRLTLAKWIVDPANPLTARVAVNHFWQMYFGIGLVKTAEDFGFQGEAPSHPELLDWLATEFERTGWDVKRMQKLMVMSAAYRQSSHVTPELEEKDPENRLIARGPRFRLPAEMVRDNALALSGLLNPKIGGAPVFPYQPPGLWEEIAFGDVYSAQTYTPSHGQDLYRRSMYTFWKRTASPPELITFDAPNREKCVARRAVTNTPLQALVLLNDPTFVEAARTLAQRMIAEAGTDANRRIAFAFRLATARNPNAEETRVLRDLERAQLAEYQAHPEDADKLLKVGESKADAKDKPVELAAWTMVASAILNLDETITKE